MKKITAVIFTMYAIIILMAHAVIPHHHHNSVACINHSHCHPGEAAHSEDQPQGDNHTHDGDPLGTNCYLKYHITLPPNNGRWSNDLEFTGQDHTDGLFAAILNNRTPEPMPLNALAVTHPLKTLSSYIFFSSTSGLRAPPLV